MSKETTKPQTVDGEVVHILAQLTAAHALIRSCEIADTSEPVQQACIVMGEVLDRLENVSDRLSTAGHLPLDVARGAQA